MLSLGWRYRVGCLKLLVLQALLLGTALAAVALTGLGIDLIRYFAGDLKTAPQFPLGWQPPASWTPAWQIGFVATAVLLVSILRALLNYRYAVESAILIHRQIVVDLRAEVYEKLQRISFRFYDEQATGSIINRVTGDVQSVRSFIDGVLIQGIILVLSLACYLVYMLKIHVGLTIACLATTPALWLGTIWFSRQVRPEYDKNRELSDQMVLTLAENIQGAHVVKGFHREPQEIEKFTTASRNVQMQQQNIFWKVSVFTPLIGFLTQVNLAILLGYGGYLVTHDLLPLGTGLVVFAGLLQQFSSQVTNMTNIANSVQQSLSGAKRVFEVLDLPIEIHSRTDSVRADRLQGAIRFESVDFAYEPGQPTLQNVSFEIAAGEVIGVLGATGAGKSTLLALLPRFYDPTAGRIQLDGVDLREYNLDDLRRNIGVVFQESFLFSNSVASNIAFGRPEATQAEIERAARIAQADEFIRQLPNGYETVLGESGMDLSGGQRQRLALARALLLDPAILLLDDPTAAIDPHTEGELLEAMRSAIHGRTTLIVAHRLSALRSAHRIVVLDQGRVAQIGTHEELFPQPGLYRETALAQNWV